MMLPAALCFVATCCLSIVLTAAVRAVAPRVGLTDRPDGHRKLHGGPIPLGGGVAVFLAAGAVIAVALVVPNPFSLDIRYDWLRALGFAAGCLILLGVGLADDRFGLRGRHKLLGQIVAAGTLVGITGLVIRTLGIFGMEIELGLLAVPFTLFWLVGAINAINLLDGIDGLAAPLGIVIAATLSALAFLTGNPHVGFVGLVFAGSLLGFLRYNFPPASIFLGDAGSMLIGLVVGALAIRASLKGAGTVLLAAPLATLALPILDSAAAIVRRRLTGRSVYATDRGHLHHRLLDALGSNRKVLAVVALACALTSAGALVSAATKHDLVAVIAAVGLVGVFAVTGLFGRSELRLLAGRLRRAASSLTRPLAARRDGIVQTAICLQGRHRWDLVWSELTEAARRLRLARLHFDVNLPRLHESFNATWDRAGAGADEDRWALDFPLVVGGACVGRLTIAGHSNGTTSREQMTEVLALLELLEGRLATLSGPALPAHSEPPELAPMVAGGNGPAPLIHTTAAFEPQQTHPAAKC